MDLLIRSTNLRAMYAVDGLMPIDVVQQKYQGLWRWSLHWLDSSVQYHAMLFLVAAIFAVALTVGYHTRLATIGSWVLLASLHTRGPLVINGGDTLLLLLLFWGMFLPLGRAWSFDAHRSGLHSSGEKIFSVATIAILLQVCLMYWCTAVFKFDQNWNAGHGLQDALMWGSYNRTLGGWMLGHPDLMKVLSLSAVWLDLIGPCLLFIPWRTPWIRLFVIAGFLGMHMGIEASMYIGLFSYVSITAWTLFLPAVFWDASVWEPMRRLFRGSRSDTKKEVAATSTSSQLKPVNIAINLFCALCLLFVIVHNVMGIQNRRREQKGLEPRQLPYTIEVSSRILKLRQKWAMFARPPKLTIWYAARAQLADGREVDLLRGGQPLSDELPKWQAATHPNHRWRKFCQNIGMFDGMETFRERYTEYLFRTWNASHGEDEQIRFVELICYHQTVAPGDDGLENRSEVFATITGQGFHPEQLIIEPWMKDKKDPTPYEASGLLKKRS